MSQTQAHDPRELLLFPPLKAVRGPNGGLVLTQKYVEGIQEYAATWPGPITTIVSYRKTMTTDMDHVEIMPTDPQIALEVRPENPAALAARVENAAMVMAFLSPFEETLGRICAEKGIPIAYTAEYAPKTERQIMHTHTTSVLRRLRRSAWIWNATRIRREMAKKAAGLQLSGTPVYDSYRPFCAESLLFFDNRVRADEILKEADLERKIADFQQDRPLRLVFGGRLIGMKGVMELPRIAQALRDRGVAFALDIFGSGPLEEELGRQIEALGLQGHVTMQGVRDFRTGWVPALQQDYDLFVCPHLQGDPSSTYPEVMACGVPIAGYANEAFVGIVGASKGGVLAPMHDASALAGEIAKLADDREALAGLARRALSFAREHCFEATFKARAQHLIKLSRLPEKLELAATA